MRGLMKMTVKVIKLDNSGKGKCKYTWANFDRYDNPIQSNTSDVKILFQRNGVTIGEVFHPRK